MISLRLERFVVAVDRDKRSEVPPDWIEQIRNIRGVDVIGQPGSRMRALVVASDGGIVGIQERFRGAVRVEKLVEHDPAS